MQNFLCKGFESIQVGNLMGQERLVLRYFQLCGRRKILNQIDFTTKQNIIEKNEENNISHVVIAYDYFTDKFKLLF